MKAFSFPLSRYFIQDLSVREFENLKDKTQKKFNLTETNDSLLFYLFCSLEYFGRVSLPEELLQVERELVLLKSLGEEKHTNGLNYFLFLTQIARDLKANKLPVGSIDGAAENSFILYALNLTPRNPLFFKRDYRAYYIRGNFPQVLWATPERDNTIEFIKGKYPELFNYSYTVEDLNLLDGFKKIEKDFVYLELSPADKARLNSVCRELSGRSMPQYWGVSGVKEFFKDYPLAEDILKEIPKVWLKLHEPNFLGEIHFTGNIILGKTEELLKSGTAKEYKGKFAFLEDLDKPIVGQISLYVISTRKEVEKPVEYNRKFNHIRSKNFIEALNNILTMLEPSEQAKLNAEVIKANQIIEVNRGILNEKQTKSIIKLFSKIIIINHGSYMGHAAMSSKVVSGITYELDALNQELKDTGGLLLYLDQQVEILKRVLKISEDSSPALNLCKQIIKSGSSYYKINNSNKYSFPQELENTDFETLKLLKMFGPFVVPKSMAIMKVYEELWQQE